jgi:prophage DNA circulation protein
MKKHLLAFLMIVCAASISQAAGGADYGRGAETDPVASALVTTVSGRVSAVESGMTTVSGRVSAVESGMTTVSGRVSAVESGSNVWNTAATNGSNWVNHASAMVAAETNVLITADAKTNTVIIERGSIKTWSITE